MSLDTSDDVFVFVCHALRKRGSWYADEMNLSLNSNYCHFYFVGPFAGDGVVRWRLVSWNGGLVERSVDRQSWVQSIRLRWRQRPMGLRRKGTWWGEDAVATAGAVCEQEEDI